MSAADYAGDVTAQEAWDELRANSEAILVDVRTQVEWQLVGRPDLSSIGKEPVFLQYVTLQGPNEDFMPQLQAALAERGAGPDTPVYFICQSGGRSRMSAIQGTALGYARAFNVADGFEGDLDENGHRSSVNGWKYAGLPWSQS